MAERCSGRPNYSSLAATLRALSRCVNRVSTACRGQRRRESRRGHRERRAPRHLEYKPRSRCSPGVVVHSDPLSTPPQPCLPSSPASSPIHRSCGHNLAVALRLWRHRERESSREFAGLPCKKRAQFWCFGVCMHLLRKPMAPPRPFLSCIFTIISRAPTRVNCDGRCFEVLIMVICP